MQFQELLAHSDNPKRFDCTSQLSSHPKCLFNQKEFTIDVPDFKGGVGRHRRTIRSADDIYDYLDYATALVPAYNELEHLLFVAGINICPNPLVDTFSRELYRLSQVFQMGIYPFPGSYLDQPALFVEAHGIIVAEEHALAKKREKDGGRKKA